MTLILTFPVENTRSTEFSEWKMLLFIVNLFLSQMVKSLGLSVHDKGILNEQPKVIPSNTI